MLQKRPAVITIMGHVDHGKTTLLDYLRHSRLANKEAGGITQHISAYQVPVGHDWLTFIDTPGHAAFNKMRERGAAITDIVVLVVAADDGVKPQTLEAIRHIKNSGVTCVVAINKIDMPGANPINVKSQLAEEEILVTEFGGDIECLEISAKTGQGVDKLLETLKVEAELLELKGDCESQLKAVVVESHKDKMRGPVADVIVQNGTLRVRQEIYSDDGVRGKVRALLNEHGQQVQSLGPSQPGQIIGLDDVPAVGGTISDQILAVKSTDELTPTAQQQQSGSLVNSTDFDWSQLDVDQKPKIKLIIKADTQGTLEAIVQNLDQESVSLISSGVGTVSDNDLELASASGATIIAFQVKVDPRLIGQAKDMGIKIREYQIIYQLIEKLQKQMLKLLEPTIDQKVLGEARIEQIFEMKGLKIAGIKVISGEISKDNLFHLKREEEIIADPQIASLQHNKQDVTNLKSGNEGALTFRNKKQAFKVGDVIVAYEVNEDF